MSSMATKCSIRQGVNVLLVQHGMCRVPTNAKEDIVAQLRKMMAQTSSLHKLAYTTGKFPPLLPQGQWSPESVWI